MSGVVEEKEERLREELSRDSEQTAYNNFTDGASQDPRARKRSKWKRSSGYKVELESQGLDQNFK